MIPSQVRYDPNATPPQFTDNEDYRIEPGTHIRVKIMGTRTEVGEMWAIGTVNEDYLGSVTPPQLAVRASPRLTHMSFVTDLWALKRPSTDLADKGRVFVHRVGPLRTYGVAPKEVIGTDSHNWRIRLQGLERASLLVRFGFPISPEGKP